MSDTTFEMHTILNICVQKTNNNIIYNLAKMPLMDN